MSCSITCCIKLLTLAKAPISFISVNVLCEFAMMLGVYILLPPQEEEVHIRQHNSQKDLNFCMSLYYYAKVIVVL